MKSIEGVKRSHLHLLFSTSAKCQVYNMVQIPGLILDCSKKKPPAKAVVYQTYDALAGFIKRPQVALTRR